MKITVTVEDPDEEFRTKLLALLSDRAAQIELDATWTTERAERYYRSLPLRARRIVEEAALRDGYVPSDDLRDGDDGSLRGHSAALKQALERGVRKGWWPQGMEPPIRPQGPGYGKVVGYRMPDELVEPFFTAVVAAASETQLDVLGKAIEGRPGDWDAGSAVGALAEAGYEVDAKRARALLRRLADLGRIDKAHPTKAVYRAAAEQ